MVGPTNFQSFSFKARESALDSAVTETVCFFVEGVAGSKHQKTLVGDPLAAGEDMHCSCLDILSLVECENGMTKINCETAATGGQRHCARRECGRESESKNWRLSCASDYSR